MKRLIAASLQTRWAQSFMLGPRYEDRFPEYGHLYGQGELYMGRWSVIAKGSRASKVLAFVTRGRYDHARLHWIRKADGDRELHDHPFNYCTFVLRGWYTEEFIPHAKLNAAVMRKWQGSQRIIETRGLSQYRCIGEGDAVTAEVGQFHRVANVSDGGVWTLFFMGEDTGKWGFLVDGRWMRSHKFFALKHIDHDGHSLPGAAA